MLNVIFFDRLFGLSPRTAINSASVGRIGRDTSSGGVCALLRYNLVIVRAVLKETCTKGV